MNIDYKKLRGLLLIFLGQFLAYGIVVVNTRSFTTDNYIYYTGFAGNLMGYTPDKLAARKFKTKQEAETIIGNICVNFPGVYNIETIITKTI